MTNNEGEANTAHREPDIDYIVWSESEAEGAVVRVPLQTVRLPQSVTVQEVADRIVGQAQRVMRANGHDEAAIAEADLFVAPLPTSDEALNVLDRHRANGEDLVLVDLPFWELCRRRLNLEVRASGTGAEPEIDYLGLKLRQAPFAEQPSPHSVRLTR